MKKNRKILSVCFGSLLSVAAVSAPLMMTSCKQNNEPKKPVQPESKRVNFEVNLSKMGDETSSNEQILKLSYLDDGSKEGIKKCRIEGWANSVPSFNNLKKINKPFAAFGQNFHITEIGDNAFYNKDDSPKSVFVNEIVIPSCIEYIGTNAFKNQKVIKSVTFQGAPKISANSFDGCDDLKEIILDYKQDIAPKVDETAFVKENIKHIIGTDENMNALSKDSYWQKPYNDGIVVTKKIVSAAYLASSTYGNIYGNIEVSLPKGDKTNAVIKGPEWCKLEDYDMANFYAENGVKFNENGKFICQNETYTITTIGESAFQSASITREVYIPKTFSKICDSAFRSNDIESVKFAKESTTIIGAFAFEENNNLSSVTLPDSLEEIGKRAFACTKLETIKLGKNIKKIGANAFDEIDSELTFDFTDLLIIPELINDDGCFVNKETCKVKSIIAPKGQSALYKEKLPEFSDVITE